MDTIVLTKPGEFEFKQTDAPSAPPPGQALVRVRRVGICGTDWHAVHGRQPFFTYPRILGHELGVEIEQINDTSSGLKPGDKCAVEPYLNCGKCIACRRGRTNCCANLQVLGVHIDGGMRSQILVPANKLHKSDKLSLDQLALVETLGIGCHAANRANVERGEWTLILGAGPIGLSVIPFVQAAGANVIVADISASRLKFCATNMKVQHTLISDETLGKKLTDLIGGDLPTVVIDATGNSQSMMRCFDLVAASGKIVFVGLFQGDVTFNDPNFHRREMTLLATRNAVGGDFKRIIQLIETGVVNTTPWITHRSPAGGIVESVEQWLKPESGVLKAIVEF
ncbi:MAG TPA: zinc-binding alcohol dehydrogenase family protein [Tepidisphaeraceae bacterium]|jgi:2-desacetyl-2-hydroxyethyl bacteriochlorophyllide A dehydrogenase|nr:zinc-binding alcohol dehydrogenase family protein [Tepidisphaeraceae bacterium]